MILHCKQKVGKITLIVMYTACADNCNATMPQDCLYTCAIQMYIYIYIYTEVSALGKLEERETGGTFLFVKSQYARAHGEIE